MIICSGCGQAFEIPTSYGRNKIQCPGCGVICPIAADQPRPVASSSAKAKPAPPATDAGDWLLEADTPMDLPTPPTETPAPRVDKATLTCRRCGTKIRRQRECPNCDSPAGLDPTVPAMELDSPPRYDDEEDANPYVFADKDHPPCPRCREEMGPDAVICVKCGFDKRKRKRVKRSYEPVVHEWDSDQSLASRLRWFGIFQAIHWGLAILNALTGGPVTPFLVTWPFLVGYTVFILGTFDHIRLERDERGRCRLIKQWRFCFVPLDPVTTEIRGYEGITTGSWHDAGFIEWFIFVGLLVVGILPGIVWYFYAIYRPHLHVALAENHGHSTVYIYRGQNAAQCEEIADTFSKTTGLRRLG